MESDATPPLRVLYVDDVADIADTAVLLLRMVGLDARACYGGAAALALAPTFRPSVCMIDLNMPGMDGDELAVRLRQQTGSPIPVLVAVTAMSDEASRERIAAAFDLHLVKPVDPFQMVKVVDTLWQTWGAIQAGTVRPADAFAQL